MEQYYNEQKRTKRSFSYRSFAQKAGISSHNLLKSLIEGKRNLTSKSIEQFTLAIGFTNKEAKYFSNLVHFNQAKTAKAIAAGKTSASRMRSSPVNLDDCFDPGTNRIACKTKYNRDQNHINASQQQYDQQRTNKRCQPRLIVEDRRLVWPSAERGGGFGCQFLARLYAYILTWLHAHS